jgi:uncharacterized protein
MTLNQHNTRTKGHFSALEDGVELGVLHYSWAGIDKFIIDHTEVKPEAKGKGVGQFLVEEAVKYARANKFQVVPLCPFANAMFKKHKEWKDVLFT